MDTDEQGADRHPYQVTLPVFEGPLDLLLYLIERDKLDITQVSLAQVTNQYLDYLQGLQERDPDGMADFLVIAAKLLLIKSRVLIPQPPAAIASEIEDEGEDLVQQLIEYRRFRAAAGWLRELESQGMQSYVRLAEAQVVEHTLELGEVTLDDLLLAVRRVLVTIPPAPSVDEAVSPMVASIGDQMDLIRRETARGEAVSFLRLIGQTASRVEVIVTLLAVLELVKQRAVTMRQDRPFGDILIVQKEMGNP